MNAAALATGTDVWLSRNLQMIRAIQRKSMRLAKAYYQLVRAIETGYTLGMPETSSDPEQVTMGDLRKQFLDLMLEIADLDKPTGEVNAAADSDEQWFDEEIRNSAGQVGPDGRKVGLGTVNLDEYIQDWLDEADPESDAEEIEVDEYDWPEEELEENVKLREIFAEEIKAYKDAQAEKAKKIQESQELTAKQAAKQVDAIRNNTATVAAGKVDKAGIDAGRNMLEQIRSHDKRVLMVARATGPNPCAFCAMLASRGFAYTSKSRAGLKMADRTHYHENCHCYPVYRFADIPDPTAAGRSEHYHEMWNRVAKASKYDRRGTKNDALNAFRRELNKERREEMNRIRKGVNKAA